MHELRKLRVHMVHIRQVCVGIDGVMVDLQLVAHPSTDDVTISSVAVGMLWRLASSTLPAALNSRSADADDACINRNARAVDMK